MRSLFERKAIPAARWQFFNDPTCNVGVPGRSRKEIIEINGRGIPFYRSTAFPKHLHYFIHGPALPETVIRSFREKVTDCGANFNGTDALEVAKHARGLCRSHGLGNSEADEFYKLALGCGLDPNYARKVRDSVKQVR